MTFEELLKACANGKMPRVSNGQISGQISVIKQCNEHFGCAVDFDNGPGYSVWYHAISGNDHRKNYMRDLSIVK